MKLNKVIMLLAALAIVSCAEKEETDRKSFGYWSSEMSGDYILSNVHWGGLAVDLNQDGVGTWELIPELCSVNGYWEPDYTAQVKESVIDLDYHGPILAVNFKLPYPDFRKDGQGSIYLNGTSTLPMTIRYEYFAENSIFKEQGRMYGFCYDESLAFLDSIEDIMITDFEAGRITIRVKCSMYIFFSHTWDSNYLEYTFLKR